MQHLCFGCHPPKNIFHTIWSQAKKLAHLISSGSQSSKTHKRDVIAAKADYESSIQGTLQVEIADVAGGVSVHHLASAIPSTSTPRALQEDKGLQEDVLLQWWLDPLGDNSLMAPLLPDAPGSKSRIRTTVNQEKRSAWKHWHQEVIYQAMGIYLEVEAKRASKEPLPIPAETVFTQDHWLQMTNEECCNSCGLLYDFHSIKTIDSYTLLFISHYHTQSIYRYYLMNVWILLMPLEHTSPQSHMVWLLSWLSCHPTSSISLWCAFSVFNLECHLLYPCCSIPFSTP